jgi:ribosomal protein L7/L12
MTNNVDEVMAILRDKFTMQDWNKFLAVFGISNMTIEDVYNALEGITTAEKKFRVMLMRVAIGPADTIKLIQTIKCVRSVFGMGLKEAKDLVDSSAGGPVILAAGLYDDEANDTLGKLNAEVALGSGIHGFKFFIEEDK